MPVKEIDQDYRINDRFIDGLSSSEMKKFVLEQKENEEELPKLMQHCLEYESVKIRCNLMREETDGKGKIKEEPQPQAHDTKHIGHINVMQSQQPSHGFANKNHREHSDDPRSRREATNNGN